jgi:hypothetical protein
MDFRPPISGIERISRYLTVERFPALIDRGDAQRRKESLFPSTVSMPEILDVKMWWNFFEPQRPGVTEGQRVVLSFNPSKIQ